MRIGFSLVDLARGGAQAFMVQLAQGLAARGHLLSYFLYADRTDSVHAIPSLVKAMDVVADAVPHPRSLLGCDVIQLDGYHSLWRKLPYLFHLGRCVETYHSAYSVRRSGPIYARHRVVMSKAVQGLLRQSSQVIYSGVPLPPDADHTSRRFDVAILGRIHPVKQHLLFLQVCEDLFYRLGKLDVLIIGDYPQPDLYQQQMDTELARLRRLAGLHIHMTGDVPQEAVFTWLAQTRVLLVTSQSEGFGRMAVEALACGVPVVANPVGGLLEILSDGQTGFLARLDDARSFADLTSRLLEDEELRHRMGQQGRSMVKSRFSLEAMLDAYEALYREVSAGT